MTDEQLEELAGLMVWGVAEPLTCDGKAYAAFEPLPAWVAAEFMGIRRRRAKVAMSSPIFRRLFASNLEAMRNGERARNLHTAITLRDDSGDGSAAFATARLKAIATIEGNEGKGGVTVNVSQTAVTMQPGYVIKLRSSDDASPALAPPAASPMTIDALPLPQEVSTDE